METLRALEILTRVRTVVLTSALSIRPIWVLGRLQSAAKANWDKFLSSLNLRILVPNFCRYSFSEISTFQNSKE